ncbi:lipopolysaccharide assembly protein LapB [Synechococcus sp. BIOS-E4-1]|uniref:tetratricopeptide repeat protein n=1 Tax=Synechococcus sp. BIOS-E4-1 TaxID=1400864 RepID=UPI0016491681|nr:tetratricopeptide repeat protein [Synechococcus sp. BIOS-E4-1]
MGAVAGLCVVAGWTVTHLWTETHSPTTIQKHSSAAEVSGLEILKTQVQSHPSDWRWSLLLARAQYEDGDREAALRTLRPLQRLHPDRLEVMTLWAFLSQETDQGAEPIKRLSARFESLPAERRLKLGMLLADLQRLSGDTKKASDRYRNLIDDNPQRPEPLLAFALLKRDQGQGDAAIALLRKARTLNKNLAPTGTDLQTLELRWALEAARNRPAKPGLKAVKTP